MNKLTLNYPLLILFEDGDIVDIISNEDLKFTNRAIKKSQLIDQRILDSSFNCFIIQDLKNVKKLSTENIFETPMYQVELDLAFSRKGTIEDLKRAIESFALLFVPPNEVEEIYGNEISKILTIQDAVNLLWK